MLATPACLVIAAATDSILPNTPAAGRFPLDRGSAPVRRALRASVTKETPGGQEATRKTLEEIEREGIPGLVEVLREELLEYISSR